MGLSPRDHFHQPIVCERHDREIRNQSGWRRQSEIARPVPGGTRQGASLRARRESGRLLVGSRRRARSDAPCQRDSCRSRCGLQSIAQRPGSLPFFFSRISCGSRFVFEWLTIHFLPGTGSARGTLGFETGQVGARRSVRVMAGSPRKKRLADDHHRPAGSVGPEGAGIKRGFSNAAQTLPATAGHRFKVRRCKDPG